MTQTAVEWLVQELDKYRQEPWKYVTKGWKEAIIETAKKMEKEQIENAFEDGQSNIDMDGCHIDIDGAKKYYNETYGK